MRFLNGLFIFIAAYLFGGINPAYIKSKRSGFDIRKTGTGNAGASNAVLSFGKLTGLLIAIADIMKAFIIIKLAAFAFPNIRLSRELAGTGCMIGHMLPVQLHFKGGKGLACLGGTILAFNPLCFLLMLAGEILLAFIVGYPAIVAITAAVIFPVVYLVTGGLWGGFALYMGAALIMECRHAENIRRIRAGTEIRASYLWNKDKELKRVMKNSQQNEDDN